MTAKYIAKIPEGGYVTAQWGADFGSSEMFILPHESERPPRDVEITEGALFLRFAELPTPLTVDAWLKFAHQYGALGPRLLPGLAELDRGTDEGIEEGPWWEARTGTWSESSLRWETEVREIRLLTDLWYAIQNPSDASRNFLREFLRTNRPTTETGSPLILAEIFPKEEDEEALTFAGQALAAAVTAQIRDGYTPAVLFDARERLFQAVELPQTLLHFLYLQFARALEAPPEFRRCGGCNEWIALGAGQRTLRARFCNESCRQRGQRKRRKEAVTLHQDGLGLAAIAERLGTTEQSVRTWIAPRRRRKTK